jgi:hypothetical protein
VYNVFRLCAGGDLAVQMLNKPPKSIRITNADVSTSAPLAQNRCCTLLIQFIFQKIKKLQMKIIKKGKVKITPIKDKCNKCSTVFEYVNSDVKHDRDGYYVNCPTCNSFIATKDN